MTHSLQSTTTSSYLVNHFIKLLSAHYSDKSLSDTFFLESFAQEHPEIFNLPSHLFVKKSLSYVGTQFILEHLPQFTQFDMNHIQHAFKNIKSLPFPVKKPILEYLIQKHPKLFQNSSNLWDNLDDLSTPDSSHLKQTLPLLKSLYLLSPEMFLSSIPVENLSFFLGTYPKISSVLTPQFLIFFAYTALEKNKKLLPVLQNYLNKNPSVFSEQDILNMPISWSNSLKHIEKIHFIYQHLLHKKLHESSPELLQHLIPQSSKVYFILNKNILIKNTELFPLISFFGEHDPKFFNIYSTLQCQIFCNSISNSQTKKNLITNLQILSQIPSYSSSSSQTSLDIYDIYNNISYVGQSLSQKLKKIFKPNKKINILQTQILQKLPTLYTDIYQFLEAYHQQLPFPKHIPLHLSYRYKGDDSVELMAMIQKQNITLSLQSVSTSTSLSHRKI